MDDATPDRALFRIRLHFGHQVVLDFRLDLQGAFNIDLVSVGFEIGHLLWRHQSKPGLCFSQGHPDAPP